MTEVNERRFIILDKEYKESELSAQVVNWIICKQEVAQGKQRHLVEIEKADVLIDFYDTQVKKYIEVKNGSDSKSKS
jgi:hypothetical protein